MEKNIALVKVTTSHSFGLEVNEAKQDEKKRNGGRDRVIVREISNLSIKLSLNVLTLALLPALLAWQPTSPSLRPMFVTVRLQYGTSFLGLN